MLRVAFRLVLIFILAYTGVRFWYDRLEKNILASMPVEKTARKPLVDEKRVRTTSSNNYQVIIDRNIFGAVLEKTVAKAVEAPVEELRPTELKLSLMGTVSGTSESSRAIISDDTSRKQDIYAVGDTVQGAVIQSIERRRVVLLVNGRKEVLDIKEREGGPADTAFSRPRAPVVRKSLRDRLNARRPIVRPSPRNRQIPVVPSPDEEESFGPENTDIPEDNNDEFVDQDNGQLEGMTDENDQETVGEPEYMENESFAEPGTY